MTKVEQVLAEIDRTSEKRLERLFELLRIPSISTDPAHSTHCVEAAQYLCHELAELGFDARLVETPGQPIVLAHFLDAPADRPHVLFYGHYDVQPADPVELWDGPPFEPALVARGDGAQIIRARGAADDKSQLRTFVEACRAWKAVTGTLPCRVSVFFEGEEESGSPSMEGFLRANVEELKADIALICDTNMWDRATPAITMSLRGIVAGEIVISAADRDLHSGLYGGAAQNPILALASILSSFKDQNGRVTLEGFYDGVREPPDELREVWDKLDFDSKSFLAEVGLHHPVGEKDRGVLEQLWARPTVEVNGVFGGYIEEGFKTVIPSKATARVSFRLVAGQDPETIWNAFQQHVLARLPVDCEVAFHLRSMSPGHTVPVDNRYLRSAVGALKAEWGKPVALVGSGGSIPIAGDISERLGLHSLLIGFGLPDDAIHSPNEKYDLSSFHGGTRSWARILSAFADLDPAATPR